MGHELAAHGLGAGVHGDGQAVVGQVDEVSELVGGAARGGEAWGEALFAAPVKKGLDRGGVVQRFSDAGDGDALEGGLERPSLLDLRDHLVQGQIAEQPAAARCAEGTSHGAPDLGGDAQGVPSVHHGFHDGAIVELDGEFCVEAAGILRDEAHGACIARWGRTSAGGIEGCGVALYGDGPLTKAASVH